MVTNAFSKYQGVDCRQLIIGSLRYMDHRYDTNMVNKFRYLLGWSALLILILIRRCLLFQQHKIVIFIDLLQNTGINITLLVVLTIILCWWHIFGRWCCILGWWWWLWFSIVKLKVLWCRLYSWWKWWSFKFIEYFILSLFTSFVAVEDGLLLTNH